MNYFFENETISIDHTLNYLLFSLPVCSYVASVQSQCRRRCRHRRCQRQRRCMLTSTSTLTSPSAWMCTCAWTQMSPLMPMLTSTSTKESSAEDNTLHIVSFRCNVLCVHSLSNSFCFVSFRFGSIFNSFRFASFQN